MKNKFFKKALSLITAASVAAAPSLDGLVFSANAENAAGDNSVELTDSAFEVDMGDTDELLLGYFENKLYGADTSGAATLALGNSQSFTGEMEELYDGLKTHVTEIAAGQKSSSAMDFTFEYSYSELGIGTVDFNTAVTNKTDAYNIQTVVECLMRDCPYEFYWMGKTYVPGASASGDGTTATIAYTVSFSVGAAYAGTGEYTVDTAKTSAAAASVANAQTIVDKYSGKTDLERLTGYKEEICDLVSYNTTAAGNINNDSYTETDPWEIIYVFDGDTNTNVVCEGYAKVFQYLCDLDGGLICYSVSGTMNGGTGSGPHMWNIVKLDGAYYLVDVTNCDGEENGSQTIGYPDELFLKGMAEDIEYDTYSRNIGGQEITYKYDDNMSTIVGTNVLRLSGTDYAATAATALTAENVTIAADFVYDGNVKTPEITVKVGETTLIKDTDYTLTGDTSATDAGDYTVTVTGTGDYKGAIDKEWSVGKATPVITIDVSGEYNPGQEITVTATAKNPNNENAAVPDVALTYKIGDGAATPFTDSFTIPENTAEQTIITVFASTEANQNYEAATAEESISVTSCQHGNFSYDLESGDDEYSGAIVEYCGNCGNAVGRLTLSVEDCAYDGKPHGATLTKEGTLANAEFDLSYHMGGDIFGDAIDTPVNVGNYTALLMYGQQLVLSYNIKNALTAEMFSCYAPEDPVYDGNAKYAHVMIMQAVTGMGTITARYYQNGEEVTPVNAGEYTVKIDVSDGREYAAVNGLEIGTFEITKAAPAALEIPTATAISYGQTLSASELSNSDWAWVDGTVVPNAVADHDAYILVDDSNYDYTSVEGYDSANHRVVKGVGVIVSKTTPTVVVTAAPTTAVAGATVSVSATASNPYNAELDNVPAPVLTYKIGDGAETAFTGSFVIPEDTVSGTTITIKAEITANDLYTANSDTTTVLVTGCTHEGTAELKWDEISHWYDCSACGGTGINKAAHSGGTADCVNKPVCDICKQAYGDIDSDNHANKATEWTSDSTGHWHKCDCGKLDFAIHTSSGAATETTDEICTICKYTIAPATGHVNHVADTGKWLSDSTGHWHKCTGCEEKMDSAPHTSDGGKTTTPATATTDGVKTYSCTVCGYVIKTEVIPATGAATSATTVTTPETTTTTTPATTTTTPATTTTTTTTTTTATTTTTTTSSRTTPANPGMPSWVVTGAPVTTTKPATTTTTVRTTPEDNEADIEEETEEDIYEEDIETDDDTDTTRPADDDEPQIKGDNGKSGWDVIADEIADADDGEKIVVDMNGATEVPEDIFYEIMGMDVDLVIELDNGFTWTINGESVDEPLTIDFGISTKTNIPVNIINRLTGERAHKAFSINHDGDFGLTAVLTVDMGAKNENLYANLYWYTDGGMKFICADKINSKGMADLTFTHASEYVIVIDETSHGKRVEESGDEIENDVITETEDDDVNPATGVSICFGSVIASAMAVIFTRKRRNK